MWKHQLILRTVWPSDQMLRHTLQRPMPPLQPRGTLDFVQGYSVRHKGRRQITTRHPSVKEKLQKAAPKEEAGLVNMPNTNNLGGKRRGEALIRYPLCFHSL